LCEVLPVVDGELAKAIVQDVDSQQLKNVAQSLGMRDLATLALEAVSAELVSKIEVERVL
jgi:type II secretory ATPase GspE/PulE/Tfp pilus assembly ATPase PilB-like protein